MAIKAQKASSEMEKSLSESLGTDSFKKEFSNLKRNLKRGLFMKKSKNREAKEELETRSLEKENYKIDKGLSIDEKVRKGWKKEKATTYFDRKETSITVLKKKIEGPAEDAFVREYIDDGVMPKHLVGEQLFNWNAVLNLELEDKLPSYTQIRAIKGEKENHQNFLKNNFQKNGKNIFPGFRDPRIKEFRTGGLVDCWLSGMENIGIYDNSGIKGINTNGYGCSLRFLIKS